MLSISFASFSQDSLKAFDDNELIRLVNHIKALEKAQPKSSPNFCDITSEIDNKNQNKGNFKQIVNNSGAVNYYMNSEVIKLAMHIKRLEQNKLNNTAKCNELKVDNITVAESDKDFRLKSQE